jgi:hypothetical protein
MAAKLVAIRPLHLPQEGTRTMRIVQPGEEFEPISSESRDRLVRIGAAEPVKGKKSD